MAQSFAKKSVTRDDTGIPTGVTITFRDGRTVAATLADYSPEILAELTAHGLAQKLGDSYSGAKGDADYAFAEASAVADALAGGEWNRRGASGGGDLAVAIAQLTGKPLADVEAHLAALDADDKAALKRRKDVKAAMATIKAERLARAAASVDTDDLAALF